MPRKPNSFIAEAVVEHLASGAWPSDDEAARLLYAPEVTQMRELVCRHSRLIPELLGVVRTETGSRAAFSLSLLRHVSADPDIAALFRNLFVSNSDRHSSLACHLIWRVLDDPALPRDWHQRLLDYILESWEAWKSHIGEFEEPTPDEVIAVVQGRLVDATYPEAKKWIYLLCLPVGLSSDTVAATALLVREGNSSDDFRAGVARQILQRFWT